MKTIFEKKGWSYEKGASLKKLLAVAFSNGLLPEFLTSEFAGLRQVLENGVGTVRNKIGGHGAGSQKRSVPKEIAAFQLNQTAATIKLLVEASR